MPRSIRGLPDDLVASLLEGLEERLARDREAALAWLGTIASILLQDYDGGKLEPADWVALRDALDDSGGELDLELLTYAMALVVERGFL